MAQKTLGYIELEWTCKRCGTKNPGTQRTCSNCGAPMEEQDAFQAPAEAKLIEDEAQLAAAQAGADIHCPYCGARNPAGAGECVQCGGDLKEGAQRQSGQVVGAFQEGAAAPPLICPACDSPNPAGAPRCQNCGASLAGEPEELPEAALPAAPARKAPAWAAVGVMALVVLGCALGALFLYFSGRTTGVPAVVEGLSWERSIPVLELMPVERAGWEDDLPQEAQVGVCELRYSHTSSDPAPAATEVCGDPYTIDEGSGLGKVVQDCQYEVYESWCEYSVQEWQVVDTFSASGRDLNPAWPGINLASAQREGERQESYSVRFEAEEDGREYFYTPDSLEEYLQFEPGSRWELQVNTFGVVTRINP